MFSRLPSTRVISEPSSFVHASLLYNVFDGTITNWPFLEWMSRIHNHSTQSNFTKPNYIKLVESISKLQYKHETNKKYQNVVVKLEPLTSQFVPLIKSAIPQIKVVMMTRNVIPNLSSFEKVVRRRIAEITNIKDVMYTSRYYLNMLPMPFKDEFGEKIIIKDR